MSSVLRMISDNVVTAAQEWLRATDVVIIEVNKKNNTVGSEAYHKALDRSVQATEQLRCAVKILNLACSAINSPPEEPKS